jgi:hypothetical protein
VTATDLDGRYEFANLPAGRYNVSASKGAYLTTMWGQQKPMGLSTPIDLAPGQTLERVDFSLPRGGVITGRILDEFGEPLAGLEMSALLSRTINGKGSPASRLRIDRRSRRVPAVRPRAGTVCRQGHMAGIGCS